MKNFYEIRLIGAGGQGLITAGMILGEAAALFDGLYVTGSQTYNPQSRGGCARSDLIISREHISYIEPVKLDIFLALSQYGYDRFIDNVKDDGIVIVDSSLVEYEKSKNLYPVPITELATKEVGLRVTANIVALGILQTVTNIVSYDALERSLLTRIPKGTEEINKKALSLGKSLTIKNNV